MAVRFLHYEVLFRPACTVPRWLLSSAERLLSTVTAPTVSADIESVIQPPTEPQTEPPTQTPTKRASFRTQENNPVKHSHEHLARYYTIPQDVKQRLFKSGGFTKPHEELCHVFVETSVMVRSPFLELKRSISMLNFSRPVVRFILYGPPGNGKTLTLAHTLHYGLNAGYLLVHVPWVSTFMRRCKEASKPEEKSGMLDLPIDASKWLSHFITQNQPLLEELKLTTTKDYQWTPRESTPAGVTLLELAEQGITRAKFACDVVAALIKEIKQHSTAGRCKTMVVIDGFNGLFAPFVITDCGVKHMGKCLLALPFLDIAQTDWCNGVVIASVDRIAHHERFGAQSDLPLHLLGKEGWEHLDPFVPIEVSHYDEAEMNSALDYYIDRRWIQNPEGKTELGRKELATLSAGNGFELMKICAPL